MEQNTLKTNVFTNETVFCETLEQSMDIDFNLPDYCSDIERILKCKAVPRIALKGTTGNMLTLDGNVSITIYYADTEGKIGSFCYSYPFEKTKEIDSNTEESIIKANAKCEYINCRAVSSRKIDIHGAIGIDICMKKRVQTEIVSDIADKKIEVLRGYIPETMPTGYAEKYLIIEEDTELSSEQEGERIFCFDANAIVNETKIINGKVLIKGDMNLKIKYSANDNIKCFDTQIPFSQVLEIETAGDTCEISAKAEVAFLQITPRINSSGLFNTCSVNAKVLICAETFCNNDAAVILDAYSKNKNADFMSKKVCFNKLIKEINETFNCKKNIAVSSDGISSVLDNWCDIKITDSGFSEDFFLVNGTVTACFIITDSNGLASFFEKPIDFSYKYTFEEKTNRLKCEPEIIVNSCNYTISSTDSIEVRVELKVKAPIYKCEEISVVTDVTESENTEIQKNDFAMIIYFASENEKLWDISKKYAATLEEIKTINDISSDRFESETTILIPIG